MSIQDFKKSITCNAPDKNIIFARIMQDLASLWKNLAGNNIVLNL